mgnify:CR=1 FL=1
MSIVDASYLARVQRRTLGFLVTNEIISGLGAAIGSNAQCFADFAPDAIQARILAPSFGGRSLAEVASFGGIVASGSVDVIRL